MGKSPYVTNLPKVTPSLSTPAPFPAPIDEPIPADCSSLYGMVCGEVGAKAQPTKIWLSKVTSRQSQSNPCSFPQTIEMLGWVLAYPIQIPMGGGSVGSIWKPKFDFGVVKISLLKPFGRRPFCRWLLCLHYKQYKHESRHLTFRSIAKQKKRPKLSLGLVFLPLREWASLL